MTQDGVEDTPARAARALTTCFFLPPPSFFRNNNHQILEFFKKIDNLTRVAKEKINNFFLYIFNTFPSFEKIKLLSDDGVVNKDQTLRLS